MRSPDQEPFDDPDDDDPVEERLGHERARGDEELDGDGDEAMSADADDDLRDEERADADDVLRDESLTPGADAHDVESERAGTEPNPPGMDAPAPVPPLPGWQGVSGAGVVRREDEVEIARRVAKGDSKLWEDFFAPHRPKLFGFLCKQGLDAWDAEDLQNEIELKAWRRLSTFEGRSSFLTWLLRIARNAVIDRARKRKQPGDGSGSDDPRADASFNDVLDRDADTVSEADTRDRLKRILEVLAGMAEIGQAFVLFCFEGLTVPEISLALGIERSTVYGYIQIARRRLGEQGLL